MKKKLIVLITILMFTNSCFSLGSVFNKTDHEKIKVVREITDEYNKVNVETSGKNIKISIVKVNNYKEEKTITPKGSFGGGHDLLYVGAALSTLLISVIISEIAFSNEPVYQGQISMKKFLFGYSLYVSDIILAYFLTESSKKNEKKEGVEEKIITNANYKLKIGSKEFEGLINDKGELIIENINLKPEDLTKGSAILNITKNSNEVYTEKIDINKFESLINN